MANFTPLAEFHLLKDIDIDVSYTHQYYFANPDAQQSFFLSKKFRTVQNGTYQRKNSNSIDVPFLADDIRECKYMMWKNGASDKWYYAFVTAINYVNPSVSTIVYQLDVYQTYLFDMQWKDSFIEREHCKRYENGLPVINTVPEGLDYGSSYRTLLKTRLEQIPNVAFCIIGCTENLETANRQNSILNIPLQMWYYIVPVWTSPAFRGFAYFDFNDASTGETVRLDTIANVLTSFTKDTKLVGKMASCHIMPFLTIGTTTTSMDGNIINMDNTSLEVATIVGNLGNLKALRIRAVEAKVGHHEATDAHSIYEDFPHYEESKLLMYPYSFTELTTERGDAMVLRNEYFKTRDANIKIGIFGTLSSIQHTSYVPKDYLTDGYVMENSLTDKSNMSLPIIDDYTASYLQSNSNSIAVSRSNALMMQQTTLQNNERSYMTAIENAKTNVTAGGLGAVASGLGAFGQLMLGNVGGAINGAVGTVQGALGTWAGYDTSTRSAEASKANTALSATTDYQAAIASVNAKYQDAQQIPDTARSMGGDYMFNISHDCEGIYLLKKTVTQEVADRLSHYFKQYGYAVNRLGHPEFHTRESWNYIKMAEPNVYGNIPMDDLMQIRDIFMKGITLWHGDWIGDYSRSNEEV